MEQKIMGMLEKIMDKLEEHDQRFIAIDERFERIEAKLDEHDRRFEAIDKRLEAIDRHFEAIDERFEAIDQRFDSIEAKLDEHDQQFVSINQRLDNVEMRLDDHCQLLNAIQSGQEYLKAEFDGMNVSHTKEFNSLKEANKDINVNLELLRNDTWDNKVDIRRMKNTMGMN
ncbi:hypothetical protein [Oceanobacillus halotolerans]|uniref:hypothetical protein n=1 Tax=Oceanobacillus halotolerans TaxID=2663380 RepID=UPI0013DC54C9|nr:hypothetical protein [Oceanobacillus halotolerans]